MALKLNGNLQLRFRPIYYIFNFREGGFPPWDSNPGLRSQASNHQQYYQKLVSGELHTFYGERGFEPGTSESGTQSPEVNHLVLNMLNMLQLTVLYFFIPPIPCILKKRYFSCLMHLCIGQHSSSISFREWEE